MSTDRIGERYRATNGMEMEIIAYHGCFDVDVRFSDGTIVKHKQYTAVKAGQVAHPQRRNTYATKRIGETRKSSCGMEMKIIAYRNANDIDIEFEDKTIVTHKSYDCFKQGYISNPNVCNSNKYEKLRLHETGTYKKLKTEIVAYRNAMDIDVKFSNGFLLEHTRYYAFQHGIYPAFVHHYHETATAINGLKMTIIAYRSPSDIDIEFEDGVVVQHRSYSTFRNGCIKHPKINPQTMKSRIGETRMANCGLKMEIIAYRTAHNMDIRFSTGEIRKNVAYAEFLSGKIKPAAVSPVGTFGIALNGLRMKLIEYRGACDIDVMFEDGMINRHKAMKQFRSGQIGHPHIGTNSDGKFHDVKTQRGFTTEDGVYYVCTFPDGARDICTPQEIMKRMNIPSAF